jgi:hypothetical protein
MVHLQVNFLPGVVGILSSRAVQPNEFGEQASMGLH